MGVVEAVQREAAKWRWWLRLVRGGRSQAKLYDGMGPNSIELIGTASIGMSYTCKDLYNKKKQDLTTTYFDITTKPMAARILLTNSTGATRHLTGFRIFGKPIFRYTGSEGYIHDSFIDPESIRKDGEVLVEIGNDYICNATQTAQIADWWWKFNRDLKHEYLLELLGAQLWLEPGNWYTAQIGAAGEAEYVDSLVQCISRTVECIAGSERRTMVSFREVEENWKYDSTYQARFMSKGNFRRANQGFELALGALSSPGYPNYLCDGSADATYAQAAVDTLSAMGGGRVIFLGGGDYHLSTAVTLYDNIEIHIARGAIVYREGSGHLFQATGTIASMLSNIYITGEGTISDGAAAASTVFSIHFTYVKNARVKELLFKDLNYGNVCFEQCENFLLDNVASDAGGRFGTRLVGSQTTGIVSNIDYYSSAEFNFADTSAYYGIQVEGCKRVRISGRIHDLVNNNGAIYGIAGVGDSEELTVDGVDFDNLVSYSDHLCYGTYSSVSENRMDVLNCRFSNILGYGYNVMKRGTGIWSDGGDYSRFKHNQFYNCGRGIYIDGGFHNELIFNSYVDCGNFIYNGGGEDENKPSIINEVAATTGCSFIRSSARKYKGQYSFYMRKTVASGTAAVVHFNDNTSTSDMHGLATQRTYVLEAYLYAATQVTLVSAGDCTLFFNYYVTSWVTTTAALDSFDTWSLVNVVVTVPSGATAIDCGLQIADVATIGATLFVDNIRGYATGYLAVIYGNYYDGGSSTLVVIE
jgi:hypothetical protein